MRLLDKETGYTNGSHLFISAKSQRKRFISVFVTERKRSETALVQVAPEAFAQGISTRKIEKLAQKLCG
jgi:transposase-like protein